MSDIPQNLRADAQRNYLRLVQAATSVFASRGPAATLENIAKRAGVGIGTMYRHFPNRRALLEAVYANKLAALLDSALLQSKSPATSLQQWLQTTLEYCANDPAFNDLMGLLIKDENAAIGATGGKLLAEAQNAGEIRTDVTIFDVLQLSRGTLANTPSDSLKRANKLLLIIMAGLKQ